MRRGKSNTLNVLLCERLAKAGLTIEEMASELEVTPRSVYRYLKLIESADEAISWPA